MEFTLSKLQSRFPEITFEQCKPPKYLSSLLLFQGDIIFCFNVKVKGRSQIFQDVSNKTSLSSVMDQTSCIGNPLEAPFSMEESFLDVDVVEKIPLCNQCPLTSDDALKVKNYCNLELKPTVPVVILCDVESNDQKRRVLQVSSHNDGWICQSWTDYHRSESTHLPTLNKLLIDHNSKITCPNDKEQKYNLQLRCQSLLGCLEDINDKSLTCCKISVQFEWSEWSVKPPLDSITDASLVVDIQRNLAISSSMNSIWKQLVLLQTYVDILENSENNSSKEFQLPSVQNFPEKLLTEADVCTRMTQMILAPNELSSGYIKMACLDEEEQPMTISKAVQFFSRTDTTDSELTDILWNSLIGCDSYQTLKTCFKELFKVIGYSKHTRPLRRTNISRLAHILSSEQLMFVKSFVDPLEYLVEMGIEKLRKQLVSIFDSVHMGLSSLNMPSLPRFIELTGSECWLEVTKNWLLWLFRLYSSLNVLLCIETVLHSPPHPLFFPVVQEVVKKFCYTSSQEITHLINNSHCSITLPISTNLLKTAMPDTDMFDDWSLTLKSSCKNRKVTSVYSRSLTCKIPYIFNDAEDADENNTFLLSTTCSDVSVINNMNLHNTTCSDVSYLVHCIDKHCISDLFSFNL